jgi:hypothetical protein
MRFVPVVPLILIASSAVAQPLDGAFTLRAARDTNQVNVNFQYEDGRSNWGRNFDRSELSDVKREGERITFTMRRDPGTFTFDGRGTPDRAAGWYGFTPSPDFQRGIEKLGFRDVDAKALFVFALEGLTLDRVRQIQRLVSDDLDTAKLVRLINHGAGVKYIQAMTDAGFKGLTSDEYRRARDHGVSADFSREMREFGMQLSLDELIRARDHGVSADYVRAMRNAGYKLSHEELIRTRDHGVSVDFMKRMTELGYADLPIAEYVRMRDHGVTAEYIEALRETGYTKLTPNELVRLRDHGVSADYVRRVKEMLKESPTVEQIIRMRNSGFPTR